MEQILQQTRPENLDDKWLISLRKWLSCGTDLDDLIFSGEEYYPSER